MVDAAAVGDVAGVLGDRAERRVPVVGAVRAQRADVEVDADEAAAGGDRVELVVGQVAGGRADRVRARVRGDERAVEMAGDVPEPGRVEVAEVDRDAELGAALDEPDAGVGEAGAGVGARRVAERHAVRERVLRGSRPARASAGRPRTRPRARRGPRRSARRPRSGTRRRAPRRPGRRRGRRVPRISRICPSHASSSRNSRAASAPTVRADSSHGTVGEYGMS